MKKRVLGLLLAAVLCVGLLPAAAFAAEEECRHDAASSPSVGEALPAMQSKKQEPLSVTMDGWTYGDIETCDPAYTLPEGVTGGTETVTYEKKTGEESYAALSEKPTDAGDYRVTVRYETGDTVYTGSALFNIARLELYQSGYMLFFGWDSIMVAYYKYSGQPITAAYAMRYFINKSDVLQEGKDYEVTKDSVITATEVGEYPVTIRGIGNYTGEVNGGWVIEPLRIYPTVEVVGGPFIFSNSEIRPDVIVKYGDTVLPKEEYGGGYLDNINAGTATAIVLGTKNYNFDVRAPFTIGKATATIPAVEDYVKYNRVANRTITLTDPDVLNVLRSAGEVTPGQATVYGMEGSVDPNLSASNVAIDPAAGTITYTLNGVTGNYVRKFVTLQIPLTMQNYTDTTLTVKVNLLNQPSWISFENKITWTYNGQPVPAEETNVRAEGRYSDGIYKEIPGTVVWEAGQAMTDVADSGEKRAVFYPDDPTEFGEYEFTVTVTIQKADITGEPEFDPIYTAGKTLRDADLRAGTLSVPGGRLEWIDDEGNALPDTERVEPNRRYTWRYDAGDNYNVRTGETVLYTYYYHPVYPITAPGETENGSITVTPSGAQPGSTVTVIVRPEEGYELSDLTATDRNGNDLPLTDEGDGRFRFVMPDGKVTVKGSFAPEKNIVFSDVKEDAWYAEAVRWAARKGIARGIGNGLFDPDGPVTRGQAVTFLYRAAGSPEPENTTSFADVSPESPYAKAAAWAKENGIAAGDEDGLFRPDEPCTRGEIAALLYGASGSPAAGKTGFPDVPPEAFYAPAVAWAASAGLTNGVGSGRFAPEHIGTRAQIVTFLFRLYGRK